MRWFGWVGLGIVISLFLAALYDQRRFPSGEMTPVDWVGVIALLELAGMLWWAAWQ